jgi:hypothetical protein
LPCADLCSGSRGFDGFMELALFMVEMGNLRVTAEGEFVLG